MSNYATRAFVYVVIAKESEQFRSLHVSFPQLNIVILICHGKYDKDSVESMFSQSYLFNWVKEGAQIEVVYPSYTLSQLYTLILIWHTIGYTVHPVEKHCYSALKFGEKVVNLVQNSQQTLKNESTINAEF